MKIKIGNDFEFEGEPWELEKFVEPLLKKIRPDLFPIPYTYIGPSCGHQMKNTCEQCASSDNCK